MSRARAPAVLKQVVVMRELLERPAVAVDIDEAIGRRERYLWAESSHVKRKIEDVGGWQVVGAKRVRVGWASSRGLRIGMRWGRKVWGEWNELSELPPESKACRM
ncbi:uncharacterized protein UTRI_01560 [Ustilago trichophora]|uniref:Uncharacterized protein n=1 Tax=Ustilago trichophora TaxID=86804 RepID=A0A5C3DXG0_9BASI|nr:uncharacterized protein UTRI_01560 [Ustilago trichophora]